MHQRDISERQVERGNAWFSSEMNAATSRSWMPVSSDRRCDPIPRCRTGALAPWHQKQVAARRRGGRQGLVTGVAPRDEVHHLEHRMPVEMPSGQQPIDPAAGRVHGDPRGDVEGAHAERVARADAGDAAAVDECRHRFDVIREHRAVLRRGERKREREPIGLGGDVVVEHRGAGEALTAEAGEGLRRAAAREDPAAGQTVRRGHAAVAAGRHDAVEREAGAHRELAAHHRPVERQREGQGPDCLRREPRRRAPLANRLARAADVQRLQVAQPAVNRAQMVERRAAAEVVLLDQGDRQPALRRVVGDRQPVNAAADHEHVEGGPVRRSRSRVITDIVPLSARPDRRR
jgi:hypothetical protein